MMPLVYALFLIIAQQNKTIALLEQKLFARQKDSTNSSKPPSTDGLTKKRGNSKRGNSGRKPGGQKGHKGTTRKLAPDSDVSNAIDHIPTQCEKCNTIFSGKEHRRVVEKHQVIEIPPIKPEIIENLFYEVACTCGAKNRLSVPEHIRSGIGENLQAHIAYLTSELKLSRRKVQESLADIFKIRIALGTVQGRLENTSMALATFYDELKIAVKNKPVLNIDETSYPHNAKLNWLWGFISDTFAFFTIQPSRGTKVLRDVLGDTFAGIIICDRFSAYVKYHKDRLIGLMQYCWSHLIRDVKATQLTLAINSKQPFSKIMRRHIGKLFGYWHVFKRGDITRSTLIEKTKPVIKRMRCLLEDNLSSPSKDIRKLCKGLLKKWDSLFTFVYQEGVEPTNNLAEQMLRAGVLSRKISYCTRSEAGQLLRARLLTVSQTCRMQNLNVLDFYRQAIITMRANLPPPTMSSLFHPPIIEDNELPPVCAA